MSLVTMKELLENAKKGGYAVGAFEFWSLDSAQAVIQAAQALNMPVILQAGRIEAEHAGGYENMYKLDLTAISEADIPVALHLDHGETLEQVKTALNAGFTAVMIDASHCSFEENTEMTCKVVEMAKPYGAAVESELGVLAGIEGHVQSELELQTKPDEAARFVQITGTDALAVAIGTAHGFYKYTPKLNIQRLAEITAATNVPIVLHGGSGTPESEVLQAINNGITKVNICTEFIAAFGQAYSRVQGEPDFKYNVPALFGRGKQAGYDLAYEKIRLFKNNREAVLKTCNSRGAAL